MKRKFSRRTFLQQSAFAATALPALRTLATNSFAADISTQPLVLWYEKPAIQWTEALPIGNGRLGAMVFGGVTSERVQLNEDTLYAGGPYDPNNRQAVQALPEVRRLIFAGKYKEASDLIGEKMMAHPIKQMPYEPVGDLRLEFPGHNEFANYRRELDLNTAIATVSYGAGGVNFRREIFSSPVDQVIVLRLTADRPRQINFSATFSTSQKATTTTESRDTLVLRGENGDAFGIKGALRFQARAHLIATGGRTVADHEKIVVSEADSALILIAVATSYKNYKDVSGDPDAMVGAHLSRAAAKSFAAIRTEHVREHQRLFGRVTLDLGVTDAGKLPAAWPHDLLEEGGREGIRR